MHFFIKLFLAAPDSGLPSALTALPSQASCLHLFKKGDNAFWHGSHPPALILRPSDGNTAYPTLFRKKILGKILSPQFPREAASTFDFAALNRLRRAPPIAIELF